MVLLKRIIALLSILAFCALIGCEAEAPIDSADKSSNQSPAPNSNKDAVTSVVTSSEASPLSSEGSVAPSSEEESGFEYIPGEDEQPIYFYNEWDERYSSPSGHSSSKSSSKKSSATSSKKSSATSSKKSSATSSRYSSAVSSRTSSATSSKPNTNGKVNYIENIINDMKLPHEALPNGVPSSYNWSQKPRVGMGVNPRDGFTASTAWGQVYVEKGTTPVANTRVQLRNMQMYYFSKSQQKWILLQNSVSVKGSAYVEDFKGNKNKAANQRDESTANGGGISIKTDIGYNYHFWPTCGRADIDPDDIAVIYSTCQARLILDNAGKTDDRSSARYLLSVGGDYWRDQSADWDNLQTNGDWAIGRFKYVTNDWQAFNGWAGDENILRNNPPPMM